MSADTRLLNEIYRESINAITILCAILEKSPEGEFFDVLFRKMTKYREIANEAVELLDKTGGKIIKQKILDRVSLKTVLYIVTANNKKDYLLGLLTKGSIEGIKEITTCINTCTDACEKTRRLAYRLIEEEENNVGTILLL